MTALGDMAKSRFFIAHVPVELQQSLLQAIRDFGESHRDYTFEVGFDGPVDPALTVYQIIFDPPPAFDRTRRRTLDRNSTSEVLVDRAMKPESWPEASPELQALMARKPALDPAISAVAAVKAVRELGPEGGAQLSRPTCSSTATSTATSPPALNAGTLSRDAALVYWHINGATSSDQFDNISRGVAGDWVRGTFTDGEAGFLWEAIDRRRPVSVHRPPGGDGAAITKRLQSRLRSKFTPRPCRKRLSDEERTKRRHRKRMLGGSSALPDTMRHYYTEGERAVLCVVAGEVKRHGLCDLSIDEIADRAGVRRTTTQNALHQARHLNHVWITERPQRAAKNLTNLVKITSAEWLTWIKPGTICGAGDRVQ